MQRLRKDPPAPRHSWKDPVLPTPRSAQGGARAGAGMQGGRPALRRRLAGEHGASAVLLALLLVPLLGFTAIAVDVGARYAEKARLQTAADAAALAVARDCARGACGDMRATAQDLVDANLGDATAAAPVLANDPLRVTVTGSTPKEHWFAPVIGHESTRVSASATVAWGAPTGGTAALPLVFSWCEFTAQTGGGMPSTTTERTIELPKKSDTGCTGPSKMFVPGGFGWLTTDGGTTCRATSRVGGRFMGLSLLGAACLAQRPRDQLMKPASGLVSAGQRPERVVPRPWVRDVFIGGGYGVGLTVTDVELPLVAPPGTGVPGAG